MSGTAGPAPAGREIETDGELWRFAVAFYGSPGVAPSCLHLQERLGADVNLLLLGIFAHVERGLSLAEIDFAAADALVRAWRNEIVKPLRQVRTALKSGPAPAPCTATNALRERIKADEVRAEQIELAVLAAWLDGQPTGGRAGATISEVLGRAARYFADDAGKLRDPVVVQALGDLSRAASEGRPINTR